MLLLQHSCCRSESPSIHLLAVSKQRKYSSLSFKEVQTSNSAMQIPHRLFPHGYNYDYCLLFHRQSLLN